MKYIFPCCPLMILLLTACSSHHKKIIVFASSDIQVDHLNITVTGGTTHQEKTLEFSQSGPVTLSVQSPAGNVNLVASDDGLYIANLQQDTVVGSYQHIGVSGGTGRITQEELLKRIDSLQQLTSGRNISVINKNYFIPPGNINRITSQTDAKIFGPYTPIPGTFDAGAVPEVYKFYTNKEVQDIIVNLSTMNK